MRGGHLTIAEETAAALRRAGHLAEVLVTPQNRFGRQASAYLVHLDDRRLARPRTAIPSTR